MEPPSSGVKADLRMRVWRRENSSIRQGGLHFRSSKLTTGLHASSIIAARIGIVQVSDYHGIVPPQG